MKYLVMETHPAYAVVLDEKGRFLRAANLHYEVGETVDEVVELRLSPARRFRAWWLVGLAVVLLGLGALFFGYIRPHWMVYGTVRLQVNPDVQLSVSREEDVVKLEALNQDGAALIDGYDFRSEECDDVVEDLVKRALRMGYLEKGGSVSVTVSGGNSHWQKKLERDLEETILDEYKGSIQVYAGENVPDQDTAAPQDRDDDWDDDHDWDD